MARLACIRYFSVPKIGGGGERECASCAPPPGSATAYRARPKRPRLGSGRCVVAFVSLYGAFI